MRTSSEIGILAAAIRLFAQRGYAATGSRSIAAEAGVTSACLRRIFGGKSGLYEQAVRAAAASLLAPEISRLAGHTALEDLELHAACAQLLVKALAGSHKRWRKTVLESAYGPSGRAGSAITEIARKLPLLTLASLVLESRWAAKLFRAGL